LAHRLFDRWLRPRRLGRIAGVLRHLAQNLQAVAGAKLSPGEGQSLVGVLVARRRAIETDELAV
jgi:hypothetical protein